MDARPAGALSAPDEPVRRERLLALALVALGLLLRLPHRDQGLVELHSWRQADGVMIARNLIADGFDLAHPRIDWVGDRPGFVGTELPLVPLLTALAWSVGGEHLALGRAVALAFFVPAAWLLWRLARLHLGAGAAAAALLVFVASPLGIHYSRALMPESAMLAAQLAALHLAARWAREGRERDRWAAAGAAALAMLLKLPAGIVLLPMGILVLEREGWRALRSGRHALALLVALVPPALWYAHAAAIARAHEPHHFFGEGNWLWSTGLAVLADGEDALRLLRRSAALVVGPIGLLAALGGLAVLARRRERNFYLAWAGGLAFGLVIGWQANVRHEYYQLPFVPLASIAAGAGLDRFAKARPRARAARLAAVAVLLLATGFALAETRTHSERARRFADAGEWVRARTDPAALLVVADGGDPTLLATAGRRGWHFPGPLPGQRDLPWQLARLDELRARGATHFVALKRAPPPAGDSALGRWVAERLAPASDRLPAHLDLEHHPDFERALRLRPPLAESDRAVLFALR